MSIPTVTTVSPSSGPVTGGTPVTITGTGFIGATVVNFGVNPATSVIVVSDTTITCVSPSGNNTIDVSVTTPDGTSDVNSPDYFTYVNVSVITGVSPSIGPVAGGLPVVVTGDHLGYSNFVIKKDQANYDRGSTNPIYAKLTSILDGSLVTTGASVVVVTDSGSGNAGAGGSPIYNAPLWSYTPTEVETDGDLISFIFTALGAIPVTVRVATDVPIPISHNWYVSVAGDDSNDGTSWDRAFATIGQAMGVAFPGDTVCIGDGSFNAPYPYPDVGMQGNGITSLTLEGKLPLNGGNSLSNLSVINTTESSLQINNMGNPYVLTNVTAYGLIDCDLGGSVNKYPYVIANMCSFGSTYDLFNSRLSGQFSNCNFNSVYNGLSSSAVRCLGGGSAVNGGTRQSP